METPGMYPHVDGAVTNELSSVLLKTARLGDYKDEVGSLNNMARCALSLALVSFAACADTGKDPLLFKLLTAAQTGVTFANTITTNDSVNVQTDVYVYNGAGAGLADIANK